jgi:hypothetical protein
MTGFTQAVLITLLIAGCVGGLLLWWGVRLVRRTVAHGRRRALELRPRFLPPGPRRDAAILRQQLATELRTTRQMFTAGPNSRIFRADPTAVLAEAAEFAAQLDDDLATIEAFPDRAQQRAALATVTPQVVQLIDTIYSARQTMLRTAVMDRDRELNRLSKSVAYEAASLGNYERAGRDLTI